jgi:hypothetical protein
MTAIFTIILVAVVLDAVWTGVRFLMAPGVARSGRARLGRNPIGLVSPWEVGPSLCPCSY